MYQGREDVRLRVFCLSNGSDIEELNRLLEDPEMNVLNLEVRTREESTWRFFFGRRITEMNAIVLVERVPRKAAAKKRQARSASRARSKSPSASEAGTPAKTAKKRKAAKTTPKKKKKKG